MSALSGVNKTRTTQAGQIKLKTTQQGVSHTQSHNLRGNALPSSMSYPAATLSRVIDPELATTLDMEYRQFIRSLHHETIAIVVEFQEWWLGVRGNMRGCFAVAVLAGSGEELSEEDHQAAKTAEDRWRDTIHPRLSVLINGHPDPDVREAADVLDKRSFAPMMLFSRDRSSGEPPSENRQDENQLAIHLIHDGLTTLRRAAYLAPFRVHRPEPDWDGVPTGNQEGLPGDILRRIKERGEHWQG